jgi:hypothetical protein
MKTYNSNLQKSDDSRDDKNITKPDEIKKM